MAAACMVSAMAAVLRFETTTTTGEGHHDAGADEDAAGQLITLPVSKPQPAPWALALLPMFWIGVAVLVVMWQLALARISGHNGETTA
jgi:cobalamin synthase